MLRQDRAAQGRACNLERRRTGRGAEAGSDHNLVEGALRALNFDVREVDGGAHGLVHEVECDRQSHGCTRRALGNRPESGHNLAGGTRLLALQGIAVCGRLGEAGEGHAVVSEGRGRGLEVARQINLDLPSLQNARARIGRSYRG